MHIDYQLSINKIFRTVNKHHVHDTQKKLKGMVKMAEHANEWKMDENKKIKICASMLKHFRHS